MLSGCFGTKSYMAPQVIEGEIYNGFKADVWSAGVFLFIMLTGFPPFEHARQGDWWYDRVKEGKHNRFWDAHVRAAPHINGETQKFINFIFQANENCRPSIKEVLEHPWMKKKPILQKEQLRKIMSLKHVEIQIKKKNNRR